MADGNVGVAGEDAPIAGRVLTYTLRADIPLPVDTSEGSVYEPIDDLAAMTVPGLQPTKSTSDFLEFSASDWRGDVVVSIDSESGTDQLTGCTEPTRGCDYVLAQSASKVLVLVGNQARPAHRKSFLALGIFGPFDEIQPGLF